MRRVSIFQLLFSVQNLKTWLTNAGAMHVCKRKKNFQKMPSKPCQDKDTAVEKNKAKKNNSFVPQNFFVEKNRIDF
jgi:hypothetical protein